MLKLVYRITLGVIVLEKRGGSSPPSPNKKMSFREGNNKGSKPIILNYPKI